MHMDMDMGSRVERSFSGGSGPNSDGHS
jgi:hypothetical protein